MEITIGQIAYEAYYQWAHGKSLATDASLPAWEFLSGRIREGWEIAAQAVVDHS